MLVRTLVIALNTYREAVRARILHGLLGLSLGTAGYSLIVGVFALRNSLRVVSDLGAASISVYSILVAIVIGATSLHRELELKTIFPILARPIERTEYLVGKYLGTVFTLAVFIAANGGVLLLLLGALATEKVSGVFGATVGISALAVAIAFLRPRTRTYIPIPWALALLLSGIWLSQGAADDRRVILGSAALTLSEIGVVAAVATVFSSFSSPFLTAVFTFGVFLVGRSADSLANLPARMFGEGGHAMALALSKVVPNLMLYVPPRTLLTGEAPGRPLGEYILFSGLHAAAWSAGLLAVASLIFRRRDFL